MLLVSYYSAFVSFKQTIGLSNKGFTLLLQFWKDVFLEGNAFPESPSENKRIINGLCLGYEKIHACLNDCLL